MKVIKMKNEQFTSAKFAKLNKNNTLAEYYHEVKERCEYHTVKVKIDEVVIMDNAEFEEFTTGLLDDRRWLAGKGGIGSFYEVPEEYSHIDNPLQLPKEIFEKWREQTYRIGLLVLNTETGEAIVVDPQGYNYARYVGVFEEREGIEVGNES